MDAEMPAIKIPVNGAETPADGAEMTADDAETPADDAETPADDAETPADVAETIADGAETPADGAETPADGAETPADGAETPADGAETPADGAEMTADDADTPADGAEPPADGADGAETPADGAETPADGTETPADGAETPADDEEMASPMAACAAKKISVTGYFIRRVGFADASQLKLLSNDMEINAKRRVQGFGQLPLLMTSANDDIFVAVEALSDGEEGVVIGYVHVHIQLNVGYAPRAVILGWVVHEKHRRLGIGQALMHTAEGWAKESGLAKQMLIYARSNDAITINLCKDLGFLNTTTDYRYNFFHKVLPPRV